MFLFKEKIKNIINFGNKKKDFKVVTEEWLEYKKNTVKQSTYYNYSYSVEKYLYPEFAGKDITKIKNYNGFIENLSDIVNVDKKPKLEGRNMFIMLSKKA